MKKSVSLQVLVTDQINDNTIQISEFIFKNWNLNEQTLYDIQCGQMTESVFIKSISQQKPSLMSSKAFLNKLYLYDQTKLQLFFDEENKRFRLGPFIGLLLKPIKNNTLGLLSTYCKELNTYSKKKSVGFYVFSPEDWYQDFVKGFLWESNGWIQQKLPKPDVVHNRIQSRHYEKRKNIQDFFHKLKDENIPYFNDHFLNKWEVPELLSPYDHIKPYFPKTILLDGRKKLEEMITIYQYIFIKPVHGSQGKQIYRIIADDKGFKLDYSTFSGEIENHFSSINELYQFLRSKLLDQRFIIQQGLSLLTYKNRPLDFRVLCHQKDGQWIVTSAIARISNEGAFVSNLSQGGEQQKIKPILEEIYKDSTAHHMRKMIIELSIEVVSLLNQEVSGLYGELGVDIAIDDNNHPWIIEINTKPSKNFNEDNMKFRPSSKAIINHCHFLGTQSFE